VAALVLALAAPAPAWALMGKLDKPGVALPAGYPATRQVMMAGPLRHVMYIPRGPEVTLWSVDASNGNDRRCGLSPELQRGSLAALLRMECRGDETGLRAPTLQTSLLEADADGHTAPTSPCTTECAEGWRPTLTGVDESRPEIRAWLPRTIPMVRRHQTRIEWVP
jgi:hypothetical protein